MLPTGTKNKSVLGNSHLKTLNSEINEFSPSDGVKDSSTQETQV